MQPMPSPPLWQLSATELARAYRVGMATPETALEEVLARAAEVNPRLNAIVTLDAAGARAAARASTQRWRSGEPLSPLDGVPITIKDNILVRGMRATWGSRLYADHVPDADETPVARLRSAGSSATRQDQRAGIHFDWLHGQPAVRADPQSVEP